jgi:precorrin-2 dehydrogenase/sirohydrochlorin ferrochelatase/precorrin-6A/cobalt-precorrin-6A reductase
MTKNGGTFPHFPFFQNIAHYRVVVVGGGAVAMRRVRVLLTCGALVTVISPHFHEGFKDLSETWGENLRLVARHWEEHDFAGAFMAVLATDDRALNRNAGEQARRVGMQVNVADAPDECTFFFPSFIAEGGTAAAVSTGGRSPGLNRRLSDRLRKVWPGWVKEEVKEEVKKEVKNEERGVQKGAGP